MRPIIFLDIDDVLAIGSVYTSYQVIAMFKSGDLNVWPELWDGLFFSEGCTNLTVLHDEFLPWYVVSSSWSNYLSCEQMKRVFRRSGLEFVAENMHQYWTTSHSGASSRLEGIDIWISEHQQPSQPILALDDHGSGWSLLDSSLDRQGLVVLCESSIGFVASKLAEAQIKLQAQIS